MKIEGTSRTQSWLALLATVAAVVALLLWAYIDIAPTVADFSRVEGERLPTLEMIQRAQFTDLEASIALRNATLFHDAERTRTALAQYRQLERAAADTLEHLRGRSTSKEGRELLAKVLLARERLQAVRDPAARMEEANSEPLVADKIMEGLRPAFDDYARAVRRLYQFEGEHVAGLVGTALLTARRAQQLLELSGGVAAFALLLLLRQWEREARLELARRDAEIQRLNGQRDALIREVHHRIKNHLQGLLALIDGQGARIGVPPGALAQFEAYVMALVSIHGLQASSGDERISLREVVAQQVPIVQAGFPGATVLLEDDASADSAIVAGAHAVPLSLALAELMLNAVKHGDGHRAHVQVFCRTDACCVSICNDHAAAAAFDWERERERDGGTGLQLVAALLQGVARLEQDRPQRPGRIRMTVAMARVP